MNKARRQQLKKWLHDIKEIKSELESVVDEEQEYYDNIPENLQSGERAYDSEEAIDKMNEAVSYIEDVICIIEEVV